MDSFFLSETCKYLYLLFDPEYSTYYKDIIFTTEGHLIPLSYSYHTPSPLPLLSSGKPQNYTAPVCRNPTPVTKVPIFGHSFSQAPAANRVKLNKTAANAPPPQKRTAPPPEQFNFMMQDDPQAQQFMQAAEEVSTIAVVIADFPEIGETKFLGAPANFGPPLTDVPLEGRLVYATPAEGCTPLFHPTPKHVKAALPQKNNFAT